MFLIGMLGFLIALLAHGLEGAAVSDAVEERLWRVGQVADRLQISRTKVFELLGTGELRSLKIGGSRRIPESAVRELMAGSGSK